MLVNTDKTGRFIFRNLHPGEYRLTVEKEGFELLREETMSVSLRLNEARRILPDVTLVRIGDANLSGVIWDESHNPLAGVAVVLPEFELQTLTDANGRFAFVVKASRQRSVNLIARKDGYGAFAAEATLGNLSHNIIMRKKSP